MEIILLERIAGLGDLGDTVRVKPGFARNYLLPQGKALRANEANRKRFESERVEIEARNAERRSEAQKASEGLDGKSFVVIRSAGETGQLYGSVSTRDIAEILSAEGFAVSRNQINLRQPIKAIGVSTVTISLHPEVVVSISVNVARSTDEAERQARGEDLTSAAAIYGEDIEEASRPEQFFEPGAEFEGEEAETAGEEGNETRR
jgi:large subunit ribosomal protein L9